MANQAAIRVARLFDALSKLCDDDGKDAFPGAGSAAGGKAFNSLRAPRSHGRSSLPECS